MQLNVELEVDGFIGKLEHDTEVGVYLEHRTGSKVVMDNSDRLATSEGYTHLADTHMEGDLWDDYQAYEEPEAPLEAEVGFEEDEDDFYDDEDEEEDDY